MNCKMTNLSIWLYKGQQIIAQNLFHKYYLKPILQNQK